MHCRCCCGVAATDRCRGVGAPLRFPAVLGKMLLAMLAAQGLGVVPLTASNEGKPLLTRKFGNSVFAVFRIRIQGSSGPGFGIQGLKKRFKMFKSQQNNFTLQNIISFN